MKRRLSPLYYIIPVIYVGVILFFIFMQFQAREEFQEKVGNLSVSGAYAKALGGGQNMKQLEVRFHDLQMEFSQSSGLTADLASTRTKRFSVESFSQFPDGFEIEFSDDTALRFAVEGELGERVVVRPIVPDPLRSMRALSLPYSILGGEVRVVKGIALLELKGPVGTTYLSLPAGSQIDTETGMLKVNMEQGQAEDTIVLERVLGNRDPYLYWFSQDFPLIENERFADEVELYLSKSYRYWNSIFVRDPGSRRVIGELGIALISESIKRGEYRKTLAVIARDLRRILRENTDNPSLYQSAAYLGNLPSFLSARQNEAAQEIERITALIKTADFSVFETPRLLGFIVNHAPFSLAEEVLRLADSIQIESAPIATLVHLVDVYLDAISFLDVGEAYFARVTEIIDHHILPSICKTRRGLFFVESSVGDRKEADVYISTLAGAILRRAGDNLANESYRSVGRNLIFAALELSDPEGFIPSRVVIRDREAEAAGELVAPERIYELIPNTHYSPREYPLYAYLYPGSWIWTASVPSEIKIDEQQYRFFFSFPKGQTHYLLIQGVDPMESVIMHGIPWKPDPQYFSYTDGWVYDQSSQTFFAKITHRSETEEIVINY